MNLKKILLLTTALLVVRIRRRKVRLQRRYDIRPLNRDRRKTGNFYALFKRMQQIDEDLFFIYTRMSVAMWNQLLELVTPAVKNRRKTVHTISVEERLCITIRYLAEGCSMQEMAFNFKLGKSTIHEIIKEMTEIIWEVLGPIYLPYPSKEDLLRISNGFFNRWNIPNCVGALDGKHISIRSPKFTGTDYLNYHKTFSIVLMATCDAFYKFTFVDIGAPGSNHDSNVFSTSAFGEGILNGTVQFPENRTLPNSDVKTPTFLVADQAFPLHSRIMRPYPGKHLGHKKTLFNYRLSRARRTIENTFGILAQRWRIFLRPMIASLELCEQNTRAAVVLHNFIQKEEEDISPDQRRYCPTGYTDCEDDEGNVLPGRWRLEGPILRQVSHMGSNNSTNAVKQMREVLADYFDSKMGSVPWQENAIMRGALPE